MVAPAWSAPVRTHAGRQEKGSPLPFSVFIADHLAGVTGSHGIAVECQL